MLSGKLPPPGWVMDCPVSVWAEGRGRDSGSRGAEPPCPAPGPDPGPGSESRGSILVTVLLTLR